MNISRFTPPILLGKGLQNSIIENSFPSIASIVVMNHLLTLNFCQR